MNQYKFIYWRPDIKKRDDDLAFCNVHIIQQTQSTIMEFIPLARQLEDELGADPEQVQFGKITKSSSFPGYTIAMWNGYIKRGTHPGWVEYERYNPNYLFVV